MPSYSGMCATIRTFRPFLVLITQFLMYAKFLGEGHKVALRSCWRHITLVKIDLFVRLATMMTSRERGGAYYTLYYVFFLKVPSSAYD